jgi:hypothetical protein
MKKSKFALVLALTVAMSGAWAKLPAPSEEAQAKAAEAKVKAAENAKMESELLGKTQDRVAQKYIVDQKAKGVIVKPTPIAPPAPPAAVPPAPTAGAAVPAPAAPVAAPAPAPAAKK